MQKFQKQILSGKYMRTYLFFAMVLLCFTSMNAQELGPDTFMVVEQLPAVLKTDSINLADIAFGGMVVPYHGKVISKFGKRGSRLHTGTDVKLAKGDSIKCAFDGVVDIASSHYGYGLLVTVKHAYGISTYYSHLSKILVKKGESVKSGQMIGLGGATGRATTTHLHFELRVAGKAVNAQEYFDFENNRFIATVIAPKRSPAHVEPNITLAAAPAPSGSSASKTNNSVGLDPLSHVILRGDTLYGIAKKYGTSVMNLCSLNGITTRTILKIGNVLKIQ